MIYKAVFCDVDGTLLDSGLNLLPGTKKAIASLLNDNIDFVIISARSPSGIFHIPLNAGFVCPVIAYSGSLMIGPEGNILYSCGFDKADAVNIIKYIEEKRMNIFWNLFSGDDWIVRDKDDPRIITEENTVKAKSRKGSPDELSFDAKVNKISCICDTSKIFDYEKELKEEFPQLDFVVSSKFMLEVMPKGISKSTAVRKYCEIRGIPLEATVAFGDNYNDRDMLKTVALPFLMGNAPEKLKEEITSHTDDNDSEGIYNALKKNKII